MAFPTRRARLGCPLTNWRKHHGSLPGLASAVGKLRTKVLRQSLEESCDGYPKGGSEEVQSTCRYPVFAKFILLDLLGANAH